MRLHLAADVPVEVRGSLKPVAARLAAPDLSRAAPDVLAVVGRPDPLLLARAEGPIVAIPLAPDGGLSAPLARADAIAILDEGDLPRVPNDAPVVMVGLPLPPPANATAALDPGHETRGLADALWAEGGGATSSTVAHGVTWIRGVGAIQTARAAAAWQAGRAVVALPPTPPVHLLVRAGCPRCSTALAAIEMTRLVLQAPALGRALAGRGRAATEGMPGVEEVARGLLEAAELARATRSGAGRGADAATLGKR